MKKYAGQAICVLCLALAVAVIGKGKIMLNRAGQYTEQVTLLLQEPVDEKTVEIMRELEGTQGEPVSFTAWREEKDQRIQAEETGNDTWANLLYISGSSELLLPYGKILSPEDSAGCLVDAETASELFGSPRVEGMVILAEGEKRVIRGVFSAPKRMIILQGSGKGQEGFRRMALQRISGQPIKALGEKFFMRHGLNGSLLRWDLSGGFSWVQELVPGKWSDFSGWKNNLQEKSKELELIARTEKSTLELEYLRLQKKGVICLIIGGILVWGEVFVLLGKIYQKKY
ncbi:MAG: hypothetical protein HFI76_07110 [Lachnospiraceae bacterium]|jgi:hypothetical protein|nr:hypothetical protein [Lachnospiraceae bacterium]